MPPLPDAAPAVGRVRVAGVLALTNVSEANTHSLLKATGLRDAVSGWWRSTS
jgi:hypothetical protein